MSVIKLTKKDLRSPDQVWMASKNLYVWMRSGATWFVAGGIILFVVIVGILFGLQLSKKNEGKAQYHYSLAKNHFDSWNVGSEDPSAKDRTVDKAKALEGLKSELDILDKQYSNSKANRLADSLRGQWAVKERRWDDAVKFYQLFKKGLPSQQRRLGLLPLGDALENKRDFEGAIKVYDDLLQDKDDFFVAAGMLGKGRCLRKLEKYSEAKQVYQKFIEKFPSSADATQVRGFLAELNRKNL